MIPLVLDLDGTLVAGDTLIECALRLLAVRPLALLAALPAAFAGRAGFKQKLAAAAGLDPASLAYHQDVLALAQDARQAGRPIYLATAADRRVACAVANHLGFFEEVIASDGAANLKGQAKADALVSRFGEGGFDYAGDAAADLPVWAAARRAIVVAPSAALLARARQVNPAAEAAGAQPGPAARLRLLSRALRLHQWAKNLLVFVPVLAAHRGGALLAQSGLGFLAFSLCASSVYLLNDLIDLPHDRVHATKRRRPFASGRLDLRWAALLMPGLLGGALAASAFLPRAFVAMLGAYYATTLAYSFVLKRRAVWDVITLAGLYTVRIFAGAAATDIPISPWLLAFSLFLFFCLAVVKRLTELTLFLRTAPARAATLSGRGYGAEDLDMLRSMAASSGYMAVLVLALYINSAEVLPLYRHPPALWVLCPILLFWISRVLMVSNRGWMHDDPVIFALRDRVSLAAAVACLGAFLAASW